jgi:hypothetical protein
MHIMIEILYVWAAASVIFIVTICAGASKPRPKKK